MALIKLNQLHAGTRVLKVYKTEGKRYCMLVAYPQSGKTGTFQWVMRHMLASRQVERVILLTGCSELDLKKQYEEDTAHYNRVFYEEGRIVILMRQDLEAKLPALMADEVPTLIVHDESHLVQSRGQTIHKMFATLGITVTGDDGALAAKNLYYLSVSATPFSESSDAEHLRDKRVIFIRPGDGYRGIRHYYNAGLIHSTFDVGSKRRLQAVVDDHGLGKWNIMRLTAKNRVKVVEFCRERGYDVFHYTSAKNDLGDIDSLVDAPARTSIILVDGRLRVGKVVPKAYIGFVWENSVGAKTDTIVQGLLGRIFGYKRTEGAPKGYDGTIHAYISPTLLDVKRGQTLSEIQKYITYMEQVCAKEVDTEVVITEIPYGTNIKKEKATGARPSAETSYTHLYRVPGLNARELSRSQLKTAVYQYLQEEGEGLLGDRARLQLTEEQEVELREALASMEADSFHTANLCKPTFGTDGPERATDSWMNKKAFPIRIQRGDYKPFTVLYDTRRVYLLCETYADGPQPKKVAPQTTKREIFCITQVVIPSAGTTGYHIPMEAQLRPSVMESSLDNTIGDWVDWLEGRRTTRPEQRVEFGATFRMDRASYKHKNSESNRLEGIREKLEEKYGVHINILYNAFGKEHFTIRSIEWTK
jgi:hypothetical protein